MKQHLKQAISALLLAGIALTGLSACQRKEPSFVNQTNVSKYNSPLAASAATPVGSELDGEFTAALTAFSEALFRRSMTTGENLVLSPLSVTYALTLTANGAEGETLGEFNALNGGIDVVRMNEYLFSLTKRMATTTESTVNVANSVWTNANGFAVNEAFAAVAEKYYDAATEALDFTKQASADTINRWVSDHTDGMIPKAVDDIDPMTAMLLINTVLFDGKWAKEYEEYQIREDMFRNADGSETAVDFLHSTENSYFAVENGVGFTKDYKDGYRFAAILPDEGVDVYDFVASLDLADAIAAAGEGNELVYCAIPKFEYDVSVNLNEILADMGFTRAFSPADAELTGLGKSDAGSLYISSVLQKAKIKLDEHGTKAAAMTEVSVEATAAAPIEEPKVITLDRPFFYMILDSQTNIPLFMGVLCTVDP